MLRFPALSIAYACAFTAAVTSPATAQSLGYTKLFDFSATGTPATVSQPVGAPVLNAGKVYGVSYYGGRSGCTVEDWQCGTFFELTPPTAPSTTWAQTTLYEFLTGTDGLAANANPINLGTAGTFYGTTYGGGCPNVGACNGTVYSLTVNRSGKAAAKTILYSFLGGTDGSRPTFLTTLGGTIYGITNFGGSANAGVVFEMASASPGAPLTESVIHTFDGTDEGAYAQYIVAYDGALYVSLCYSGAYDGGTIVKLTPPASPGGLWTSTVIFSFGGSASTAWNPEGISFGPDGNIYGSLQLGGGGTCTSVGGKYPGCGAIFQLTPPSTGTTWNYTQIYGFQDGTDSGSPYGPPAFDSSGNMYVSSTGTLISPKSYGAILELTPQNGDFAATVIHTFKPGDGVDPAGMLTSSPTGTMYGFATYGGKGNNGTFYELSPISAKK